MVPPRSPQASGQVIWLMSLRVVIVTTLLLSALLVQSITDTYFSELNPVYYLVGLTYFLTLGYALVVVYVPWRGWFIYLQLFGDLLIITGLIYYSGGLDSAFPFLYILTIITGSILLMRRGGLLIALVACILYGTLVALIYNRVIGPQAGFLASVVPLSMNQVYYNLFVRWIGFLAAAMLSSYLAEKLRETGESLKARNAELAKLQVYYEDIINSVNSGLVSTDLAWRVVSLNHAGERILERLFADVRARPVAEVFAQDGSLLAALADVGASGVRLEVRYPSPSGLLKHVGVSVSRLQGRENLHLGYTFVFQDLSVMKELEREVRLKDRLAAVGSMAAGMAHEIRNPLASMSGSIQILKGDLELQGEQMALMEIVLRESDRLNRTIEDFLFFARPSPPLPRQVDLGELVEEAVTLLRNSPELKPTHEIVRSCGEGDLRVEADANHVKQVVWNLLRNAVQAMPEGGRIVVRLTPMAEDVRIEFEDEGAGFADEDLEQLWQPFHTSRTHGTGLGLALVYRIIRDHGGRISVGNRVPHGARVALWLPRAWSGDDRPADVDKGVLGLALAEDLT